MYRIHGKCTQHLTHVYRHMRTLLKLHQSLGESVFLAGVASCIFDSMCAARQASLVAPEGCPFIAFWGARLSPGWIPRGLPG